MAQRIDSKGQIYVFTDKHALFCHQIEKLKQRPLDMMAKQGIFLSPAAHVCVDGYEQRQKIHMLNNGECW